MTKINTVVFDFDGTIADSFDVFLEALEEVLNRPNKLTTQEIQKLRGLATRDLIKELRIKKWQVPRLIVKGRRAISTKMDRVKIFDGMPKVITNLAKDNYKLYLLSTNNRPAIEDFLNRNGLEKSFTKIYAGTSVFGKAKRLKSLLKKENLRTGQSVYIGDETRDVEAAHKAGLKIIVVGWGYNTPQSLAKCDPDKVVAKPEELVPVIESWEV